MPESLCLSVTFLDPEPRFHGRGDGAAPEWPPSPLRLFQAIVAANADVLDGPLSDALDWLEQQSPPTIVAPESTPAAPYCLSVPNNAMDLVGRAWSRGNTFGSGDANPATHRTMKDVRPLRMTDGRTVHYVWSLDAGGAAVVEPLVKAAGRIAALGWGVDLVVGCARLLPNEQLAELAGERWLPTEYASVASLRTPRSGTLDALGRRHEAFLNRVSLGTKSHFAPPPPLSAYASVGYRRTTDPAPRPYRLFEFRDLDGDRYRFPLSKATKVAGMARHLAIEAMKRFPPADVPHDWVNTYVAGHAQDNAGGHRQLSYLPLPSVGHEHTDPGIRRLLLAGSPGEEAWVAHAARRIAGRQLKGERGDEFGLGEDGRPNPGPLLVPLPSGGDNVTRQYMHSARVWRSFTPVVLPGHDDHKPAKRERLIEKALAQSGVTASCEFEPSTISRFRKAISAHKYETDKPTGAKRWRFASVPKYLQDKTWTHLTITFDEPFPGPLVIGAGRHCGFGLMVGDD